MDRESCMRDAVGCGKLAAIALGIIVVALVGFHLFVTLVKSRKLSQREGCLGNLKRMSVALEGYMQDWDDTFPLVTGFGPELDEHEPLWGADGTLFNGRGDDRKYMPDLLTPYVKRDLLRPFAKKERCFICLSSQLMRWHVPDGTVDFGRNGTTYIFNAWCVRDAESVPPASCTRITGQSRSICKSPADAPLVWDGPSGYALPSGSAEAQIAHDDVINVLNADGHVRSVQLPDNKPPWNGTEGRTCHFWGAPNPDSGTTYGATGWF